ncbi:hypothetical protein HYC85_030495 [Camellia sinensis]|uniref:Uncharacterized protein n=1 Tax=Camellia sinensis TaxID=4442 RepID=A0A7J7G4S0_CAMSI|nr:hypothetical protein HYC85_030495 [Camellia sinensis]
MEWVRGWLYLAYEMLFQRIMASHLQNPMPLPPLHDLTCIITGSTSGIGLQIARQLAESGAHVVMAVRNTKAAHELIRKWQEEWSGMGLPLNIEVMELDLLSLDSVVKFAEAWNARSGLLHVLINNAGIFSIGEPQKFSKDGYEEHMQVNHLAPALLSVLLLPSLIRGSPSRIINVNSIMHYVGFVDTEDMNVVSGKRKYTSLVGYSSSKLAQGSGCGGLLESEIVYGGGWWLLSLRLLTGIGGWGSDGATWEGLWKEICLGRGEFWERVNFRVGIGEKEATVASYLGGGEVAVWDIQLRREVQDWEVNQLGELLGFLYGAGLSGRGEDVLVWSVVGANAKGGSGHVVELEGGPYWSVSAMGVVVGAFLFDVARDLPKIVQAAYRLIPYFIFSAQEGSRSALFAATDPQVPEYCEMLKADEWPVCAFLSEDCRPTNPSEEAHNLETSYKVWEKTLDMIGLPLDAVETLVQGDEVKCRYGAHEG